MIQRAVMSYWSGGGRMIPDGPTLRLWALSVTYLRRIFPEVTLCADEAGHAVVGWLPFTSFQVMPAPPAEAKGLFGFGKLMTYTIQDAPFLHVDHDVFIRKPLPDRLLQGALVAQSPETWTLGDLGSRDLGYNTRSFAAAASNIPSQWRRALLATKQRAINTGIFGGHDLVTIKRYVSEAMTTLLENPDLAAVNPVATILNLEQHLLAQHTGVELLFASDPVPREIADAAGFTHLLGPAKQDPYWVAKVEAALHREAPQLALEIDTRHPDH